MALPKLDAPLYEVELPLSKKVIQYRPFLVKEQRNLLMALESNEIESIEKNVRQVLNNCTVTEGIDIDQLPVVDVEYFFIQLRAKSVGEIAENKYRCNNEITSDDGVKECGNIMEVDINLLEIKVEKNEDIRDVIQLTDKVSVKLNYPKFSIVNRLTALKDVSDFAFELIADSVDYIHDGEQFYYAKETPKQELIEFIESLNQTQFAKIENFFSNLPKLRKEFNVKCSKCGFEHHIEAEGLESFFD